MDASQIAPDDRDARHAQVVIVGAGLTGLCTAIMLREAGVGVIVLEQGEPGALASGHNTGKATLLQGSRLSTIRRHHPARLVRAYVDANRAGLRFLGAVAERVGIPVQESTAYSYAQSPEGLETVDAEIAAGREAGLMLERVDRLDVPFPLLGAAALPGQLAVDPMLLVTGLAAETRALGARIVTGVRALGVRASEPAVIRTSAGEFTGDRVVIATGAPILDRGLYFAKVKPMRSQIASFRLPQDQLPDGLFISVDAPIRSIRRATVAGEERLWVGGGSAMVGDGEQLAVERQRLIDWTGAWYPDASDAVAWAAQDYVSLNQVPFVGRMPRGRGRVYVATGYAKWGLTNAAGAAIRLSTELLADRGVRRPGWATVIGTRITVPADLAQGAKAGLDVGIRAVTGWARAMTSPSAGERPAEGHGVVERRGIRPTAVSTVDGTTCAVSAVCPHLGGIVNWNPAEQTWDCPLHASRFDAQGRRIEGPAVHDLAPADASVAAEAATRSLVE
ncbi:FAD-dependent oxidoreductase [Agromyces silvae]|uniref:FAD-dependent oxidoreductase n=1 Tax=Agromyces silvae TaxID=3388266 RepID=UPI00280C19D7|nr:FAD-dependent oxidoreductase [Agromyces protaetiae]